MLVTCSRLSPVMSVASTDTGAKTTRAVLAEITRCTASAGTFVLKKTAELWLGSAEVVALALEKVLFVTRE